MPNCAVYGCGNYNQKTRGTDIKYFRFPKDPNIANIWINKCNRKDKFNVNHARICSVHFAADSYKNTLKQRLLNYVPQRKCLLKADAVPTENLPNTSPGKKRKTVDDDARNSRMVKRQRKQLVEEILQNSANSETTHEFIEQINYELVIKEENEDPEKEIIENLEPRILELEAEIDALRMENAALLRENQRLKYNL